MPPTQTGTCISTLPFPRLSSHSLPMACLAYPALLPTRHPQYFCACRFMFLRNTLIHAPFCTFPLHSTPTQNRPCTRSTEFSTGTLLSVATTGTHTHTHTIPQVHTVRTHTKLFKHSMLARAGPTVRLTLGAAGDTAQCSGTCLTRELSSPESQQIPCPEHRALKLNSLSLAPASCSIPHTRWQARKRRTRAVTDVSRPESYRTRDSGRI